MIWVHVTGFISPEYKKVLLVLQKNNLYNRRLCTCAWSKNKNKMAGNGEMLVVLVFI